MGRKLGPYPHTWRSGPDEINHRLYIDCQRARAQANYRGEVWTITEQEYIDLWRTDDRYKKKGRTVNSICLSKIDQDLDWTLDNVHFVTRQEHFKTCSQYKMGKYRARRLAKQQVKENNV